jgi:hypothetical protein
MSIVERANFWANPTELAMYDQFLVSQRCINRLNAWSYTLFCHFREPQYRPKLIYAPSVASKQTKESLLTQRMQM